MKFNFANCGLHLEIRKYISEQHFQCERGGSVESAALTALDEEEAEASVSIGCCV